MSWREGESQRTSKKKSKGDRDATNDNERGSVLKKELGRSGREKKQALSISYWKETSHPDESGRKDP